MGSLFEQIHCPLGSALRFTSLFGFPFLFELESQSCFPARSASILSPQREGLLELILALKSLFKIHSFRARYVRVMVCLEVSMEASRQLVEILGQISPLRALYQLVTRQRYSLTLEISSFSPVILAVERGTKCYSGSAS